MDQNIILCSCQGNVVNPELLESIENHISEKGISYHRVKDLCSVCATKKDQIRKVFHSHEKHTIFACYPRTVEKLLEYADIKLSKEYFETVNLREIPSQDLTEKLKVLTRNKKNQEIIEISGEKDWPAWYPVIDKERCTVCGQCADFCLFGVYEKSQDEIRVVQPQQCKNNCPACARICPQTAIIFPKYELGGAIAGSGSIDEEEEQKRRLHDLDSILGNDIYKALELRKQKRKSIISSQQLEKAMEERENALKDLK